MNFIEPPRRRMIAVRHRRQNHYLRLEMPAILFEQTNYSFYVSALFGKSERYLALPNIFDTQVCMDSVNSMDRMREIFWESQFAITYDTLHSNLAKSAKNWMNHTQNKSLTELELYNAAMNFLLLWQAQGLDAVKPYFMQQD